MPRPTPPPSPTRRPVASPSAWLRRSAGLALAAAGLLLASPAARAQIVHEKPGAVKAANRRALREALSTGSPYKESHLDVTPDRLRRGESTQPAPEGSDELDYKRVAAPRHRSAGLLGLGRRHKKKR